MGCSVGWWGVFLGFLCCFCVLGNEIRQEERPRLVSGEYQPRKSTMFGSDYEWIQTSLEFDQPMYLSESFLCPGSEEGCPPFEELGCVPCDFTNPEVFFLFFFFFFFFFFFLFFLSPFSLFSFSFSFSFSCSFSFLFSLSCLSSLSFFLFLILFFFFFFFFFLFLFLFLPPPSYPPPFSPKSASTPTVVE